MDFFVIIQLRVVVLPQLLGPCQQLILGNMDGQRKGEAPRGVHAKGTLMLKLDRRTPESVERSIE